MQHNFKRGVVPTTRLTDTRRLTLFSSTQFLQTAALLSQAKRERDDLKRKLQQTADQRHLSLISELQNVDDKIAATRARLRAVGEKLMYTGLVRSQLVRGL